MPTGTGPPRCNRISTTHDDGTVNYYYDDDNGLVNQGGSELDYDNEGNLIPERQRNRFN